MANVPTDRRSAVRVLLRLGTPFDGAPSIRRVAGYMVMIVGEAKRDDWPPGTHRVGDLEGVVWTTPRQVGQVVRNLRAAEGIVAAKSELDELDDPGA